MFFPRRPPPPPPPPPHPSFRVLVLKTLLHIDQKLQKLDQSLDPKIDQFLQLLSQLESKIMASFDDLKASQDATDALIGKVKTDVETLAAMIAAIPPAGMTPEQQAGLDAAKAHADSINDKLSAVDAMTADPAAPAPVEPAPTEPTA